MYSAIPTTSEPGPAPSRTTTAPSVGTRVRQAVADSGPMKSVKLAAASRNIPGQSSSVGLHRVTVTESDCGICRGHVHVNITTTVSGKGSRDAGSPASVTPLRESATNFAVTLRWRRRSHVDAYDHAEKPVSLAPA